MKVLTFSDDMNVLVARTEFFAGYGFGSDGGYRDEWVKLKLGPVPVTFPNTQERRRSVMLHDLHHITTGYTTTWQGEGEISAWEVGGGCGNHLAAWGINLGGLVLGILVAPRATWRAFVRGRHSVNLYHLVGDFQESLLQMSVGELRSRMGLNKEEVQATGWDRLYFVLLLLVAIPWSLVQAVVFVGVLPLLLLAVPFQPEAAESKPEVGPGR